MGFTLTNSSWKLKSAFVAVACQRDMLPSTGRFVHGSASCVLGSRLRKASIENLGLRAQETLMQDIRQELARNGFVRVPGVLPLPEAEALMREVEEVEHILVTRAAEIEVQSF